VLSRSCLSVLISATGVEIRTCRTLGYWIAESRLQRWRRSSTLRRTGGVHELRSLSFTLLQTYPKTALDPMWGVQPLILILLSSLDTLRIACTSVGARPAVQANSFFGARLENLGSHGSTPIAADHSCQRHSKRPSTCRYFGDSLRIESPRTRATSVTSLCRSTVSKNQLHQWFRGGATTRKTSREGPRGHVAQVQAYSP
jgi:hypothetical protein